MKKKLLIVLGGGGHTAQMQQLVELLDDNYNYDYVVTKNDVLGIKKADALQGSTVHIIDKGREIGQNIIVGAIKQILTIPMAIKIIKNSKADAIVTCGPGIGLAFVIAAKLLHKKSIWIESRSRVFNKSTSGKLAYPLADLFMVQWPEMKSIYPRSKFAGRLE
jgi:beta-1,4-N-acetylglucosaminyltransferase